MIRREAYKGLVFSDRSFPITAAMRCVAPEELELLSVAQDWRVQIDAHAYRCPPTH